MLSGTIIVCLLIASTALAGQTQDTEPGATNAVAAAGQKPPAPPAQPPPGVPPGQKGPPPGIAGPPGKQPPPWAIPRYRLLREDEDWSYLADPQMRGHDWLDPLKYIPLGNRDHWYLTLGADARWWYEYFHNENWGTLPFLPSDADEDPEHNEYLLQRHMFHGDFHLGRRVRAFGQLKSSIITGRAGGPRPIIDSDELDINQAFVDAHLLLNREKAPRLTVRVGRQEMFFGSGRLVANRDGPNVRLSFDGVRVIARTRNWRFDTFGVKPVITLGRGVRYPPFPPNPDAERARGYFDDRTDPAQTFWGTFATGAVPTLPFNLDMYYFGLRRRTGIFDQGIGPEERHTVGGRIWRGGIPFVLGRGWDYDAEFAYQFGKFGPGPRMGPTFPFIQFAEGDIRAWTLSTQTGYTFRNVKLQPRIGVTTGIATGDKDLRDPNLQTFFTPFPNGRFFGNVQANGPLNIQGVRPNFTIQLPRAASLTGDAFFFWRQQVNDGVYNIPGFLLRSGRFSQARYIGTQPGAELYWPLTKHMIVGAGVAYFITGRFLEENPPDKNLLYGGLILMYRF